MNDKERINLCSISLEACKCFVNTETYNEINEYINKYNEWGVGIEMLIDIISENETRINCDQFTKLQKAMESMGLGQSDRMRTLMNCRENS